MRLDLDVGLTHDIGVQPVRTDSVTTDRFWESQCVGSVGLGPNTPLQRPPSFNATMIAGSRDYYPLSIAKRSPYPLPSMIHT